jgi:hypothetical protein
MSSTSSITQNVRRLAISSNFDRRVHVVGGCREFRISPDDNRNGCDRQWMSSSIRVISDNFFLRCKSLHELHLKPAHNYLNLQKGHFLGVA